MSDFTSQQLTANSQQLRLFDSRRKQVLPFEVADGRVRMYVCGITPYDTTHLGHAFTYLVFDVLGRNLRRHGHTVTYVQNVTDVDDDLLRRARRDGRDWRELAEENVRIFRADLEALGITPPDHYPYASGEIEPIVAIVGRLLEHGHAYRSGGNVYFRAARVSTYGELSGYGQEEMRHFAAMRGADPNDPNKEDPLDFILWQRSLEDEPSWETPWGPGRPGWHIECSAMAYRYLGEQVDVHGGGGDLIYPHHESEIAQSETFTSVRPFARFWVHAAMLYYGGEKMSKSLGNMVFVRDLCRRYSADAIRLCLLSRHYRTSFNYEESELQAAQELAERIRAALQPSGAERVDDPTAAELGRRGLAALDDDLETPGAIAALRELVGRPDSAGRERGLREIGAVLGLTYGR